jgi:hypothetical protein
VAVRPIEEKHGEGMAKRGRPRKNGVRNGAILGRELTIVHAYDKSRGAGEKYETAIRDAEQAILDRYRRQVSTTEVKRVLARFRPKNAAECWLLEESILQGDELTEYHSVMDQLAAAFPEQVPPSARRPKVVRALTGSIGALPRYPRINQKIADPRN